MRCSCDASSPAYAPLAPAYAYASRSSRTSTPSGKDEPRTEMLEQTWHSRDRNCGDRSRIAHGHGMEGWHHVNLARATAMLVRRLVGINQRGPARTRAKDGERAHGTGDSPRVAKVKATREGMPKVLHHRVRRLLLLQLQRAQVSASALLVPVPTLWFTTLRRAVWLRPSLS